MLRMTPGGGRRWPPMPGPGVKVMCFLILGICIYKWSGECRIDLLPMNGASQRMLKVEIMLINLMYY